MKLNTFYKQGAALALCLTLSFPVFAEKDLVHQYFARNKLDLRIELGKYLPDYGGSLSHE